MWVVVCHGEWLKLVNGWWLVCGQLVVESGPDPFNHRFGRCQNRLTISSDSNIDLTGANTEYVQQQSHKHKNNTNTNANDDDGNSNNNNDNKY